MVFFLDKYILASYFLLFYEYEVFPALRPTGNLRISRFYDITHEQVVTPATEFGIYIGNELTGHEIIELSLLEKKW